MDKVYVTMMRTANCSFDGKVEEYVNIWTFEEARQHNWIDENGERVWVLPAESERYAHTFVWAFDNEDEAIAFYEALTTKELGMKVLAH
jgi:cell division septal protein FtsQ